MKEADLQLLRSAISAAESARASGNHPFGAVLADEASRPLLTAENTVATDDDFTAHAEMNLARIAARRFSADELSRFTVYASTEPCPMCAGALHWLKVCRVVYALSQQSLHRIIGNDVDKVPVSCRSVLSRNTEVVGPLLEEEASRVHEGFWK